MTTIAFIPVADRFRLLESFSGRPLLYWCLRALAASESVDRVVVSTSDDEVRRRISEFGLPRIEFGAGGEGPDRMLTSFIREGGMEPEDWLMVVPAACPFLTAAELDRAVGEFADCDADRLVTVCRTPRRVFSEDGDLLTPLALVENGAFSLCAVEKAVVPPKKICLFCMGDHTALSLDTPEGRLAAEAAHRHLLPDLYPALGGIRMLLTDVDGVLTDAGMYYGEGGDELKKFSTRDGMAFPLLRAIGLKIGIITGEDTRVVARRAEKLKADHLYQGISDKLPVVEEICAAEEIALDEVAYVGDDIGDLEALRAVGFAACPASAEPAVKQVAHYVCERGGGEGCVREVAELILAAKGRATD